MMRDWAPAVNWALARHSEPAMSERRAGRGLADWRAAATSCGRAARLAATRVAVLFACVGLAISAPSWAQSQAGANRAIRIVVPYGAGGAPDVIARVLSQKMSADLAQQIVVDNRPGAGGIVAAELVVHATPDGNTLFIADLGHMAINPATYPNLPYKPLTDFAPISQLAYTPLFMAATPSINSVHELIEQSHNAHGLHYGSSGNGSPHHLGMELFKLMTGAELIHIPYKGVAQSVPALLAGDVSVIIVGFPSIIPHARAGKVRLLGVTTARRTPLMPELATVAESGASGYDINVGVGLLAPAGTPREVIKRLHDAAVKVIAEPETARYLIGLGIDPFGSTPEQYSEILRTDLRKYDDLVRRVGVKVD